MTLGDHTSKRLCIYSVLLCLLIAASCHRGTSSTSLTAQGAPPPGFYRCWSGGFAHLPAGTFTLTNNGRYESYRPRGGGRYAFSASTSVIDFLDGDYRYWEYRGIFQPAAQSRPDSSRARDRIVLMPLGATDTIGTERPGEYQYCYLEAAPPA